MKVNPKNLFSELLGRRTEISESPPCGLEEDRLTAGGVEDRCGRVAFDCPIREIVGDRWWREEGPSVLTKACGIRS